MRGITAQSYAPDEDVRDHDRTVSTQPVAQYQGRSNAGGHMEKKDVQQIAMHVFADGPLNPSRFRRPWDGRGSSRFHSCKGATGPPEPQRRNVSTQLYIGRPTGATNQTSDIHVVIRK